MHPLDVIWIFFLLSSLQPLVQKQLLVVSRRRALALIAKRRDATVITLIHRQEAFSFFGLQFARYIDMVLRDPAAAAVMGEAAAAHARNFTWSTTAARLRRLYADLTTRALVDCA